MPFNPNEPQSGELIAATTPVQSFAPGALVKALTFLMPAPSGTLPPPALTMQAKNASYLK